MDIGRTDETGAVEPWDVTTPLDDLSHEITHGKKRGFLAAFAETGNVSLACQSSGIARRTHYDWVASDELYARAFTEAQKVANDNLHREARRRAVEGLRKYKFHEGLPVMHPETGQPYYEHEYSDTLLIFLMKGAEPEKYRDSRMAVEHSGEVRETRRVVIDVVGLTDEQRSTLGFLSAGPTKKLPPPVEGRLHPGQVRKIEDTEGFNEEPVVE